MAVREELRLFKQMISDRCAFKNAAPPLTLKEAVSPENVRAFQGAYGGRGLFAMLQNGRDIWGSPFHYRVEELRRVKEPPQVVCLLTIRSIGPNRRDDGGEGDDLQWQEYFDVHGAQEGPGQ
jgi:hypothetical protein